MFPITSTTWIVEGSGLMLSQNTISFLRHSLVKKHQCLYFFYYVGQIMFKQCLCFKANLQNKQQNWTHREILAGRHKVIQSTCLKHILQGPHPHTCQPVPAAPAVPSPYPTPAGTVPALPCTSRSNHSMGTQTCLWEIASFEPLWHKQLSTVLC